jgi:hypothetical protein
MLGSRRLCRVAALHAISICLDLLGLQVDLASHVRYAHLVIPSVNP